MNPVLNAYFSSDLFGKIIFLTLFLLSIITWAIFLQKYFLQRDAKRGGSAFLREFAAHHLSLDPKEEHPYAALYRVLKYNVTELLKKNMSGTLSPSDLALIKAQLSSTCSSKTKELQKHLFVLSTVVSLAPFLGLLGTVWGILLTLEQLQAKATLGANATIMGDLSMALGTTVFGLLVAIPALIAYNYLRANISYFATDMDDFSQVMISSVELQYRKIDV